MKEQGNGESMQLEILISNSSNFIYIDRLDDIVRIAAMTKTRLFYLDAESATLFGSFEEPYSVIITTLPFMPTASFYFSSTMYGNRIAKDVIDKNRSFFFVPEYPWILFPENRRASLMAGRIAFDYENFQFVDISTSAIIEDCLMAYNPNEKFIMDSFVRNYYRWKDSWSYYSSGPSATFKDIQNYESIQWVIQNKVTEGSTLMNTSIEGKRFSFYIFKALIGSLTKQDSLDMNFYFDPFLSNTLVVEFIVHKKKVKIGVKELKETDIKTYIRVLNLADNVTTGG